MAFSFGLPIAQQDPAGVDLGAALARLTGGAPAAYAQAAQAVPDQTQVAPQPDPQAQAQQQAQPWKGPSFWDIAQGMLFNGGQGVASPNEAYQKALATHYAQQNAQILGQAIQNAPKPQQLAMIANLQKFGEEYSKNFAPVNAGEGTTETMFGGPTAGGYSTVAPKLMLGPAGQPGALTQNGWMSLGPQLEGKKSAANGVVLDENKGLTGQTYTQPQVFAPGSSPGVFTTQVGGVAPQGPLQGSVSGPLGGGAPQAPQSGPAGAAGKFDALNFIKSFIIPHEGGLNPHDMNGSPTKFGINQSANPGVDVAKLTPDQAASIYQNKYLPMSGAANLPPALAAVHLDTSVINPAKAQQFLQQSNGDPAAYLALRQQWMQHMVQTNPAAAPYANAWAQRNADLGKIIAGDGGAQGQQAAQGAPGGWSIGAPVGQPRILSATEAQAKGFVPGTVVEQGADGKLSVTQAPEYGPDAKSNLRNHVLTSDEYKQAQASMAAYKAMIANANTMTGPGAYSMLDTFARAINPGAVARPTVIQTLEHSLGPLNGVEGGWDRVLGQGNLTPQVRQQIIDAVAPFAQAHWDQAKMLNDANVEIAKSHHIDNVGDVTAPLEDRPQRMIVTQGGAISEAQALAQARQAIQAGAPRDAVLGRLKSLNIQPAGL